MSTTVPGVGVSELLLNSTPVEIPQPVAALMMGWVIWSMLGAQAEH